MSFAGAFDMVFTMKDDLETMLQRGDPVIVLGGSKSLFDIITKTSFKTKKRLMTDLQTVIAT